jgi:hypothetical protein
MRLTVFLVPVFTLALAAGCEKADRPAADAAPAAGEESGRGADEQPSTGDEADEGAGVGDAIRHFTGSAQIEQGRRMKDEIRRIQEERRRREREALGEDL